MVSFDNPMINYTTLTLGDLLGLCALLTICCAQIYILFVQICYHHRSRRESSPHQQFKKNYKNHAHMHSLQKINVLQLDRDEKQIEFKPLCRRKSIKDVMVKYVKYSEDDDDATPKPIDSIYGPMKGSVPYTTFVITLILMIIAGSSNDFLGKLIYQIYPGNIGTLNGLQALKYEYWLTFALTIGSFFVCMFALFTPSANSSFPKLDIKLFFKISIPSIMDVVVTGGRYLALVFMPAALISLLKNGSQLIFLACLRRMLHGKKLLCAEWFGIAIIIIGLLVVASMMTPMDSAVGISLMIGLGFSGAIRNDIEEVLLKNEDLDCNFIVGVESFISLTFSVILGGVLFVIDPFNNINEENIWGNFEKNVLTNPLFILIFVLFLIAIFVKDTMQMKLTFLSSCLTRKLFQQLYPSVTWFISLATFEMYCVFFEKDENGKHTYVYGESWEGKYSWIRLSGFMVVVIGSFFYIKGHFIFQKFSDLMSN